MRKQVFGRKFKRDKDQRKALFNGLISAMVLNGSVKTTEEKAKSIKADVEKLVTKAKKGETSRRLLQPHLKPLEIDKMIKQIGPTFKDRNGGYTRITRLGKRFNDNASMVIMQWVDQIIEAPKEVKPEKPRKEKPSSAKASSGQAKEKKTVVNKSKKVSPSSKGSRGKKETK